MLVFFIVLGLMIGSFLNVVIYRVPHGKSIAFPSSHCPICSHSLSIRDNIPVFSYILSKGKCKYCEGSISIQYPIVEILTGVLFGLLYLRIGFTSQLVYDLILISLLFCIAIIDIKHQIIPDSLNFILGVLGVVMLLTNSDKGVVDAMLGFLAGGGILFLIALVGPMGGGDIKFMAAMGLWLGFFPTIMALILSFISGGVVGTLLIVFKVKDRKDHIPFGPFLVFGVTLCYWFYYELLIQYLSIIS